MSQCSTAVCKFLIPALIGVAVILLILYLIQVLKKDKHAHAPAAPPTQIQVQAQGHVQAYPRNIPSFPVKKEAPESFNTANGSQYSAYESGNSNVQVAKMLDQRYVQKQANAYSDNKMNAYQNYADTVGGQGQLQQWDEATFNKLVLQQKIPALVGFVMNGCGPCEATKPKLAEAAKHAKIAVALVERGAAGPLLQKYQITGFPTLWLFRGGENVRQYNGDRSVEDLLKFTE